VIAPETERRQRTEQPLAAATIPDAQLSFKTVTAVTGFSEATIRRRAASDPTFPKLIRHGKRCTRIRAGDLMAWLAAQAK
jgi:predicted DNA-binding transcriptional regulator AlpA